MDGPAVTAHCAGLMERFDVRPREPTLRSSGFSGGNQQKLVLAREMTQRPKVLLVGQPTRGVDIGAIEFIHRELVKRRDEGCAILVVSVELEEILSLSDRILVMFGGRIMGELPATRADERTLGLMMAGAHA
jgi:simple sugar transport system ATP-binding protein